MGILLSEFMWPYALASLPAGYLVNRVGMNKVMLISMITWSLACVLGGLVVGFYSILITRLIRCCRGTFFYSCYKIIQQRFPASQRGIIPSIVALSPRIANILAPMLFTKSNVTNELAQNVYSTWNDWLICCCYIMVYIKKQRIETNISYRRTQKVSITNALKNKNVILFIYW